MKENVGKFFEIYASDPTVRSRVEENVAAYPGSYEIREALTEFALLPVAEEHSYWLLERGWEEPRPEEKSK